MTALITWEGVGRTFISRAGGEPVAALRPTTLSIDDDEYLAIVGPSGSGKSTLLNVLGLLDRPTMGSYLLGGVDVGSLSERARTAVRATCFGFVFQAFHLLSHQPVIDNVGLGLVYAGVPPRERSLLSEAAVDQVGLSHRRTADPATLSGGERQRVAIARALVTSPRVLLCDEPTGNLDSTNAAQILRLLDDLHAAGTAVVIVTHDHTVARHAARIIETRDGRIVRDHLTGAARLETRPHESTAEDPATLFDPIT